MSKLLFNREPYFDTFKPISGYQSVLFRPKRTIQTRELNELQSILSSKVEAIGDHLFKFGSVVKSGSVRFHNDIDFVRLKDTDTSGNPVNISFVDKNEIRGVTSGLIAQIIQKSEKDEFDPATIFVNYKNTAIDGVTKSFLDGEELEILDSSGFPVYKILVRCPTCPEDADPDLIDPTGKGSLFAVEPSSYYIYGNFVETDYQNIILSKYSTRPSYKVGFDIVQNIVTSQDDSSLNDNALGTPNFSAPGADRYRISLVLNKKPLTNLDDENFVSLAKIEVGILSELRDKPQYAELMNTLARRTYDESGNYTIEPYSINFKEHLSEVEGSNIGYKTAAEGGDESKVAVMLSPGKAYVRGREVEHISETIVPVDKARDSDEKRSTAVRAAHGNYFKVTLDDVSNLLPLTDVSSALTPSDYDQVVLYSQNIVSGVIAGNIVGYCRIKSIEMVSGFVGGTGNDEPIYALYIFDIKMEAGRSILDVRGVSRSGSGNQTFGANIVLDPIDGTSKIYEPTNNSLLFKIPFDYVRSVRDADNPLASNTSISVTKKLNGAVNSLGIVTFIAESNETFLSFDSRRSLGGLQNPSSLNYEPFDLTQSGTVVSGPTTITIDVGVAHTGKDFVFITEVLTANVKEKTKSLNTVYLTGIPGDVNSISLGVSDGFRIKSVIDVTTANPSTYVDVTDQYDLNKGIFDNYYGISTLELKSGLTTPIAGTLLNISVEYFEHIGSSQFFSVDSYTALVNDANIDFGYDDIPTYTANDGTVYNLTDTFDFRQKVGSNNTFAGTGAKVSSIPVNQSNIIFDLQYYLPRTDLIVINELGKFVVVKGVPEEIPAEPIAPENTMPIYALYISAYTFDISKDIKTKFIDNRRYTMRDIGKLEKRINNLEYYVSFNLLEKATSDLTILDSNGNSRFKNGFLVDNFQNYNGSNTSSGDFSCALDTSKGELRPGFESRNIALEQNEALSSHFAKTSNIITLPYTEETYQEQPYSSKTISVNPYLIFELEGKLELSPNLDVWRSPVEPAIVTTRNSGIDRLADVVNSQGVLGTAWGNWSTPRNQDVDDRLVGTNTAVETAISRGSTAPITSVNIIPFIRPAIVQFAASNMKPRTKVYAFFDGVDVTEDCRPINGARGEDLVTNETGAVIGVFLIPNNEEKRFFTGTRIFKLTNSPVNSEDPDEVTTTAQAQYFAGGIAESRSRRGTSIETTVRNGRIVARTTIPVRRPGDDPLAQSFTVNEDNGVCLTSVDLYFSGKDETIPVWFQIRSMENGYPGKLIMDYSEVTLQPEDVNVSEDGSVATNFKFQGPVYLEPDEEFCFVVGSSSEVYRIHTSKLGGEDVITGATISTQPHIGSLFKSQNDSTWTAEQFEDIKFKMNRAEFDISTPMNLVFNNSTINEPEELNINPIETEMGTNVVRIYHPSHGMSVNDRTRIDMLKDTWHTIHLTSGTLRAGQILTTGTNITTATIEDIQYEGTVTGNEVYKVRLGNVSGPIDASEAFAGNTTFEDFRNPELLQSLGIKPINVTSIAPIGTFVDASNINFNGIPLADIAGIDHVVQHVDSMDSYIIHTTTSATGTGRTGGSGGYGYSNIQLDAFNVQADYKDFTGESIWKYTGVTHQSLGGNGSNYLSSKVVTFEANEDVELPSPNKLATKTNESLFLGAEKSLRLDCIFTSDDPFISPIMKYESIRFTSISNRVDYNTEANYNIAPNATGRWVGEETNSGTTEPAKYLMNPVNLKNPATNIKVYMDLLKTLDSDVLVYARTLPVDIDDDIVNMPWVAYDLDEDVISEFDEDFKEGEVSIPGVGPVELPEFKAFQIKLVLRSKNPSKPPKVRKFRAIAVL